MFSDDYALLELLTSSMEVMPVVAKKAQVVLAALLRAVSYEDTRVRYVAIGVFYLVNIAPDQAVLATLVRPTGGQDSDGCSAASVARRSCEGSTTHAPRPL